MPHPRLPLRFARLWPVLFLAVLPGFVHLPALTGYFRFDPLYIVSGLTAGTWHGNGWLPGYPGWIDGNAGVTTQALGALAARDWLHGVIPYWNPYSGIGMPLAGEGQTPAMFLPFVLLLALPHGLLALRMLLMAMGGLASFALLRRLRLDTMPALVGAVLFELNGSFAWQAHGPMMPVAFLPLMLLGAEQARADPAGGGRWPLALVAGVAWSFLSGFPETAALDLLFVAGWCGLRLAQSPARLTYAVRSMGAAVAGLLIAAPAIWPFLQGLPYEFLGTHAGAVQSGLTAGNWALLLFPYLYGNIMQGPLLIGKLGALWASAGGYADLVLVALAGLALRRRAPEAALRWALLAWIGLTALRAAAFGPALWVFGLVPLLRQAMVQVYVLPSWSLALSVLAALTLQDWRDGRRLYVAPVMAGVAALAVAALLAAQPDLRAMTPALPHWVPVLAVSVPALLLFTILGGLWRAPGDRRAHFVAGLIIADAVVLAGLPLFAGSHGRKLDVAAIAYLQSHVGLGRVVSFGPMVPNYGAMLGVAEISHNYLPVPQNWADYVRGRLLPNSDGVNFYQGAPPTEAAFRAALPAYQAMGVRYALAYAAPSPPAFANRVFHGDIVDIWALPAPTDYFAPCQVVAASRQDLTADCPPPGADFTRRELVFPGWTATVNGSLRPISGDLFQTVHLPGGTSVIHFDYAPPGMGWSWIAAVLGLGVAVFSCREGFFFFAKKKQETLAR
jgi:hypothetical protein